MNDERYKKIMTDLGMPNSTSLLLALRQVSNETKQECNDLINIEPCPCCFDWSKDETVNFCGNYGVTLNHLYSDIIL